MNTSVDSIPESFIWPEEDRAADGCKEMKIPTIDLKRYFNAATAAGGNKERDDILQTLRKACSSHGVFQVVNHGVNAEILAAAIQEIDSFFSLPLAQKRKADRKIGESSGFSSSFLGRFACNLPWKETLSVMHSDSVQVADYISATLGEDFIQTGYVCLPWKETLSVMHSDSVQVADYISATLGEDFIQTGLVLEEYCKQMNELGLVLMELVGLSLGLQANKIKNFYKNGSCILRLNYYPSCKRPDLVLGTRPHYDPTSLTILQQDDVSGLQVFHDNQWLSVTPLAQALVINIGDTFTALSNGVYKSCLHRAVANSNTARRSIAYFMNPPLDKVVMPPRELLVGSQECREYPDFTWSQLLEFTQKLYRADMGTLSAFSKWLSASAHTNPCKQI